ncbi:MAG: hypothetical protein KAR38_08385, partial [Calditrichia bacterium]|nr:hypothetical protein [Calditrichia bacterium]
MSENIKHMENIPVVAQELSSKDKLSFLFLGNSLIEGAVNEDVFLQKFANNDSVIIRSAKVVPNETGLVDWYFILKNYFIKCDK